MTSEKDDVKGVDADESASNAPDNSTEESHADGDMPAQDETVTGVGGDDADDPDGEGSDIALAATDAGAYEEADAEKSEEE